MFCRQAGLLPKHCGISILTRANNHAVSSCHLVFCVFMLMLVVERECFAGILSLLVYVEAADGIYRDRLSHWSFMQPCLALF